jgi:tRNA pseudouridine55 synthase
MNGVVLIDKPCGKTSFDVVEEVRRAAGVKKAGHTGTLDPLATGVLPVCLNEATKLVQFLVQDRKEYRATMLLGVETDTLDIEGRVTARREIRVDRSGVEAVLKEFIGRQEQVPPRFSSIKHRGKPLHRWAREGFAIDPPRRVVEVYRIGLEQFDPPYITFSVFCSKGTYIRSLCRDIGEKLQAPACLSALIRTRSGSFIREKAVRLEGKSAEEKRELLESNLIPMAEALSGLKSVFIDNGLADRIARGYQPAWADLADPAGSGFRKGEVVKLIAAGNHLVALGRVLGDSASTPETDADNPALKILRVINR